MVVSGSLRSSTLRSFLTTGLRCSLAYNSALTGHPGTLADVRVLTGLGKLLLSTLLAGVLVAGLMLPYVLGLGLASNKVNDTLAATETVDLQKIPMPQVTTVTDSKGATIATMFTQNRRVVNSLDQISPYLPTAVMAIEDRRFMNTAEGVDWRGMARALVKGTTPSGNTQGGSTLTQQYVKNYRYLVLAKTDQDRMEAIAATPLRKLQEAKQALALPTEYKMSKNDILLGYLNLVAFGPSVYGAQAAAQYFFGVDAKDLTLAQSALLAAMVNNPNKYNPFVADKVADTKSRRDLVLSYMQQYMNIPAADVAAAKKEPLGATQHPVRNGCLSAANSATNGYFCEYALSFLQQYQGLSRQDLASGGYTIRTTMDPVAMNAAVSAVRGNADPQNKNFFRIANAIAMIQPAPKSRRVVALAANRPYGSDKTKGETLYKLPTNFAPLGAGSTFKVFTAAEAMKQGLGTSSVIDSPAQYTSPLVPSHPFNNSGNYPTSMTLQQALRTSPNTAFVSLEDQVGLPKVVQTAVDLGMKGYELDASDVDRAFAAGRSYQEEVTAQKMASFTLGVSPVSPLELANVGATLASQGEWCPPTPIDQISDVSGNPVAVKLPGQCTQAVDAGLANSLAKAMEGDVQAGDGTAHSAMQAGGWDPSRPAAGKTGTTESYKSSAYLGFTPYYSAAVLTWDYLDRPQSICIGDNGKLAGTCKVQTKSGQRISGQGVRGMSGGSVPATTWFTAMAPLHKGLTPAEFSPGNLDAPRADLIPPSVVNKNIADATSQLEQAGYKVVPKVDATSGAAPNTVVGQSPAPGAAVLKGATITLMVSAGQGTGG